MSVLYFAKTSFSSGELAPDLLGRGDLKAYENGAMKLRNVFIYPTGGISRRNGLRYVDTARGKGRIVAFEFNTEQTYILVFTDGYVDVYKDDTNVASFVAPWTESQIPEIRWTQSADTLLVTHKDVAPRKITRISHASWTISTWSFEEEDGKLQQPYYKFAGENVTLTPSGTTGNITVTASSSVFQSQHNGLRLRLLGGEILITAVNSGTSISATVKKTLENTDATAKWEEPSFSAVRGYPVSATYHQDRLVIGGSRDLPNRLWLSKSGALMNFDLGEGLDDEAIEFPILSDQVNAVCAVFSGRHLQVFTSGAEWMVTGEPLTPSNIQLLRQTRIGSKHTINIPPINVDGATIFAGASGKEVREFLFTDLEQAYQASDLAMLSKHLVLNPVDQDYDSNLRILHIVMADGTMALVTNYRTEKVTAWSLAETNGKFISVAVMGNYVYVLIERENGFFIEVFDETLSTDSGLLGYSEVAKSTWSGIDHLEGQTVKIKADNHCVADNVITEGKITLEYPANSIEIGLGFSHLITPLPPTATGNYGVAPVRKARMIEGSFRVIETPCLKIDTGNGLRHVILPSLDVEGFLDSPLKPFSGDVSVKASGWIRKIDNPMWKIEGDEPLNVKILSVTTKIKLGEQ